MTESRFAEGEVSADRDMSAKVRPLPPRHRLGEFELDSVVGTGGFGIVYRAFDRTLQRTVAVKEYMPAMLAQRAGDYTVGLRASRFSHAFEAGRTAFLNEARLLAQFDHPGLLKVLHFWESHGTAYMVMPFYEGQTLAQRNRRAARMSEPELLELLAALLSALHTLHRAQCFHRDISLDNILVQPGGQPVLLDFGAARKLIGDLVDDTAMILKPGYAPIEQYTDDPAFKQGPWTDIYALGAVAYALVTGELPPAAVVRSIQDQYQPLAGRQLPDNGVHYSERVLAAIDAALALRIDDRPESLSAFAQRLGLREPTAGVFVAPDRAGAVQASVASGPVQASAASVAPELKPLPVPVRPEPRDSNTDLRTDSKIDPRTAQADVKAEADTRCDDEPSSAVARVVPAAEQPDDQDRAPPPRRDLRRFVLPALALLVIVAGGIALLRLAIPSSAPAVSEPPAQTTAQLPAPQPVQMPPASSLVATNSAALAAPTAEQKTPSSTTASAQQAPASITTAENVTAVATAASTNEAEHPASTSASVAAGNESPNSPTIAVQSPVVHSDAVPVLEPNKTSPNPPIAVMRSKTFPPVRVRLYVVPWGEVYVNGIKRGVSPPFRSMNLAPGTYRIEIRNGTLPPMVRVVTLDVGEAPVDIRYSFD